MLRAFARGNAPRLQHIVAAIPQEYLEERDLPKQFWAALDGTAALKDLHITILNCQQQLAARTVGLISYLSRRFVCSDIGN